MKCESKTRNNRHRKAPQEGNGSFQKDKVSQAAKGCWREIRLRYLLLLQPLWTFYWTHAKMFLVYVYFLSSFLIL